MPIFLLELAINDLSGYAFMGKVIPISGIARAKNDFLHSKTWGDYFKWLVLCFEELQYDSDLNQQSEISIRKHQQRRECSIGIADTVMELSTRLDIKVNSTVAVEMEVNTREGNLHPQISKWLFHESSDYPVNKSEGSRFSKSPLGVISEFIHSHYKCETQDRKLIVINSPEKQDAYIGLLRIIASISVRIIEATATVLVKGSSESTDTHMLANASIGWSYIRLKNFTDYEMIGFPETDPVFELGLLEASLAMLERRLSVKQADQDPDECRVLCLPMAIADELQEALYFENKYVVELYESNYLLQLILKNIAHPKFCNDTLCIKTMESWGYFSIEESICDESLDLAFNILDQHGAGSTSPWPISLQNTWAHAFYLLTYKSTNKFDSMLAMAVGDVIPDEKDFYSDWNEVVGNLILDSCRRGYTEVAEALAIWLLHRNAYYPLADLSPWQTIWDGFSSLRKITSDDFWVWTAQLAREYCKKVEQCENCFASDGNRQMLCLNKGHSNEGARHVKEEEAVQS
jgi:hypothetical protein